MFMSFSKNKFTLLWQNSVTDVSDGFRPPSWSIQVSTKQTQPTYGVEPRPHGWEASALTTAPPLVPSSGGW